MKLIPKLRAQHLLSVAHQPESIALSISLEDSISQRDVPAERTWEMKTFSPEEQSRAHFLTADTSHGVHKVNDKPLKKFRAIASATQQESLPARSIWDHSHFRASSM